MKYEFLSSSSQKAKLCCVQHCSRHILSPGFYLYSRRILLILSVCMKSYQFMDAINTSVQRATIMKKKKEKKTVSGGEKWNCTEDCLNCAFFPAFVCYRHLHRWWFERIHKMFSIINRYGEREKKGKKGVKSHRTIACGMQLDFQHCRMRTTQKPNTFCNVSVMMEPKHYVLSNI